MRYRVAFANPALGRLERLVFAESAAEAACAVLISALAPLRGSTEWDAPLVNFESTVQVTPEPFEWDPPVAKPPAKPGA